MAVFTAIATAILGAVGVAGTIFGSVALFNVAVGVIAAGLAIGTAKLFGIYDMPKMGDQRDPGVKIQLPPATDNKVPKLYGKNFTGSIIIDAEIKNQNKTMAYAMVISEYSSNDTWTISNIFRGDARLNFGAGASAHVVQSITDPNATASTKVQGKMRCRVYAGGSEAVNQIFPTTNKVAAYSMFNNWTASNSMDDLVFAIFEMDYDAEEGLTGLGAITYEINNALNEPSNVLLDYLQNTRYGAGIDSAMIDTTSFDDWYTFAQQPVDYIDQANATLQHVRYQIDGALSTFDTARRNIDKICQSGGAFFTYNAKQGKFGVVPNRKATPAEQASAFVFDDDNIISAINITSTELYSLYNAIEVEYPSVNQKDQTDVYFANVDVSLLNPNEPDNTLKYRLEMCNDRARVSNLANVDLNQNRLNTILEFDADFSAMQVDVGDVVKVTSDLYGYNQKLFRCMRLIEKENAEGALTVNVILLEYDDDVYGDLLTQEDLPVANTGITNWWIANSNAEISLGNILIFRDPLANLHYEYSPVTGNAVDSLTFAEVKDQYGSIYFGNAEFTDRTFINIPINIPGDTTFNTAKVTAINADQGANSRPVVFTQSPSTMASANANSYFDPNTVYDFSISTWDFSNYANVKFKVGLEDSISGSASRVYETATLTSNHMPKANVVGPYEIQDGAYGFHWIETPPDTGYISANTVLDFYGPVAFSGYSTLVGNVSYGMQCTFSGTGSGVSSVYTHVANLELKFWYHTSDYLANNAANVVVDDYAYANWWAPEGWMFVNGTAGPLTESVEVFTARIYGRNGHPLSLGVMREVQDMRVEMIKIGRIEQ